MNRLIEAIDKMASTMSETFFIQTGNSTYKPKNCEYKDFVDALEFQKMIENCSILVTHSGVGTIMRGIDAGKPVLVVPRLARYHEHVDDHQVQIAKAFAEKNCVIYCDDLEQLPKVLEDTKTFQFQPYKAPESKIVDIILDFVHTTDLIKSSGVMSSGK